MSKGDRVFLLRQGTNGRGIVASGTTSSAIYSDVHWRQPDETANFIDLDWECVVAVEDRLPIELLKQHLPDQWWHPFSSGSLVKAEIVGELEGLWSEHLAGIGRGESMGRGDVPPGNGQTHLQDAERRKKIEDAAQDRLMEHYSSRGWIVTDTRLNNPYDATAEKCAEYNDAFVASASGTATLPGPDFLYLEAKGTTSPGNTVLVTCREVEHARAHQGAVRDGDLGRHRVRCRRRGRSAVWILRRHPVPPP